MLATTEEQDRKIEELSQKLFDLKKSLQSAVESTIKAILAQQTPAQLQEQKFTQSELLKKALQKDKMWNNKVKECKRVQH